MTLVPKRCRERNEFGKTTSARPQNPCSHTFGRRSTSIKHPARTAPPRAQHFVIAQFPASCIHQRLSAAGVKRVNGRPFFRRIGRKWSRRGEVSLAREVEAAVSNGQSHSSGEQVFAKRPSRTRLSHCTLQAAMMRTSTLIGFVPPSWHELASWMTRRVCAGGFPGRSWKFHRKNKPTVPDRTTSKSLFWEAPRAGERTLERADKLGLQPSQRESNPC